jgi:hypothetical protein
MEIGVVVNECRLCTSHQGHPLCDSGADFHCVLPLGVGDQADRLVSLCSSPLERFCATTKVGGKKFSENYITS